MPDSLNTPTVTPLIVLKIGGSVLATDRDIRIATHEIYRWIRRGFKVVAVVSAIKGRTDALLKQASGYGDSPEALAQLCATGEHEAVALLGLACDRAGIAVRTLDAAAVGIRSRGSLLDAEPVSLNAKSILDALSQASVTVVPGFIGRNEQGQTTLLGRGGSDFSAIFIAHVLGARCRLIKDVSGLFDRDPLQQGARRYERVSWTTLKTINGKVLQAKAAACSLRYRQPFEIGAPLSDDVTLIGGEVTSFTSTFAESAPLRVALCGCGVVGRGVFDALADLSDRFQVVSVLVRDIAKAAGSGIPSALLTTTPQEALAKRPDVVIELLGGINPARDIIADTLVQSREIVTGNKAVIAACGPQFAATSGKHAVRCSASVGGAVPVLELLEQSPDRIVRIEGILNGTTNYILSRLAEGVSFADALKRAQELGFAEQDPSRDLGGLDAADKLKVISQRIFGINDLVVDCQALSQESFEATQSPGCIVRHIAELSITSSGPQARVTLRALPLDDSLASINNEHNAVQWTTIRGETFSVQGKGAGRWPTTQAVVADCLDVFAAHLARTTELALESGAVS